MSQSSSVVKRLGSAIQYDWRHNKMLWLLSLPGLALLIVFRYFPMYGIIVAFKDYSLYKGIMASKWVGFYNFQRWFADPYFWRLIRNTFVLGALSVLWTFPAPILLALILNEVRSQRVKRVTQTISYLPYFISTVIIVGLMKTFLSPDGGVINKMIGALTGAEPIPFFNESRWFRTLYIASDIWQGVGYGSIIYLAAIMGIDPQLYEAARIDGSTRLQSVYHITLPSILPTIAVLLVMRLGALLSVGFEKIFLMYSSTIYETADVISTYVYRRGFTDQDFGFATAVGLFNSVISVTFLVAANLFSRKVLEESLW